MRTLDLVALLVFTYGAIVYSAMIVAWATAPRRLPWQGGDTVGLVLGALSAAWFVFHAASAVWPDGAWSPTSRVLAIALSTGMSFAYPPLIMHVTWVELDPARRARLPAIVRAALPAMYIAAASAIAVTQAALWRQGAPHSLKQDAVGFAVAGLFIACALWSAYVSTRAGRAHESPALARTQRVYVVMFVGMAIAFVLMLVAWRTLLFGRAIEIVVKSLPLLFLVGGTWVEDRLTFYDIFLKRGLTLFVLLFLLTGWFALVLPWLDGFGAGWWRPWAFALVLLPLAAVVPVLVRAGERWLDRAWFGRRVSTFDAIGQVLDAADEARDETALMSRLAGAFGAVMNLPVRITAALPSPVPVEARLAFGPVAGPADPAPEGDGATLRGCHMMPASTAGASMAAGVAVGIDAGDGRGWCVTVESGDPSRALLSEDVVRLRTLARVAGPMLRAMRVQQTVRDHEVRTQQLALDARRAELRALRAQIDPHFLFNALNAVAGLVHVDAERADRAVEALSEVFRYTLRASEREWARLDDELAFAQAYLDVERARFGEARLAVNVRCDQVARAVMVPALVVQTLVENAIKHGVSQVRGLARVDVDSWIEGNDVVVTVANDGPPPPGEVLAAISGAGAPAEGVSGGGHGLANIRARLAGYFGGAATLTLTRDAQTRATLRIPRVCDQGARAVAAGHGAPAPGTA